MREWAPVVSSGAGDGAVWFLDRTPFYAESGGQVGDTGELDEQGVRFAVADTQKYAGQFHGHLGKLAAGTLKVGDHLGASVDGARRGATILNPTATHPLRPALRQVLGTAVPQTVSPVAPARLRFRIPHFQRASDRTVRTTSFPPG